MVKYTRMKIATVTLHLPCNYGNALQMLALQAHLKSQGYNADVLSVWYFDNQDEIRHASNLLKSGPIGWINLLVRLCSFTGYSHWIRRERNICRWLSEFLTWSREQGSINNFPCKAISYDTLIVGSDQIWNPAHSTSKFFRLAGFDDSIRKIAYAASLGCDTISNTDASDYLHDLSRFKAISLREASGANLISEKLGLKATHVADPTLLLSKAAWLDLLKLTPPTDTDNSIFFYFVSPNLYETIERIIALAKSSHRTIHVFTQAIECPVFPPNMKKLLSVWRFRLLCIRYGVKLHLVATPTDFVQQMMKCEYVVTDSFHGMMFSTILGKKCNLVIGNDPQRKQMSARIHDFTSEFGDPSIITADIDLSAAKPLGISERLGRFIEFSKTWLANALSEG